MAHMYNVAFLINLSLAVHGCLLRLTAPGLCESYLVDARFTKRVTAKAAVCLQAMSEGAGYLIRSLAKEVGDRLTPETRRLVSGSYLPTLISECRKRQPEIQFQFDYILEADSEEI